MNNKLDSVWNGAVMAAYRHLSAGIYGTSKYFRTVGLQAEISNRELSNTEQN
jgi:hypothetical protein